MPLHTRRYIENISSCFPRVISSVLLLCLTSAAGLLDGCKKNENVLTPQTPIVLYSVTARVVDTLGHLQAGALVILKDPPTQTGTFVSTTDTGGRATIQAPAGTQVLIARSGNNLQGTITVNVQAGSKPTDAGTITLRPLAASLKVLVVITEAESLQTVLRALGFTTFDTTYADTLQVFAQRDSTGLLTYLSQYGFVFSNCNDGLEANANAAILSRTYGRYISAGGKMLGGHCNFYHLQRIWPGYFKVYDNQENEILDSLEIIDPGLNGWLGFSSAAWDSSSDSRRLSGYEKFLDLPPTSKVYATISWTSPQIGVIVANPLGKGTFVWTNYHNEDIVNSQGLRKIIEYFLLTL